MIILDCHHFGHKLGLLLIYTEQCEIWSNRSWAVKNTRKMWSNIRKREIVGTWSINERKRRNVTHALIFSSSFSCVLCRHQVEDSLRILPIFHDPSVHLKIIQKKVILWEFKSDNMHYNGCYFPTCQFPDFYIRETFRTGTCWATISSRDFKYQRILHITMVGKSGPQFSLVSSAYSVLVTT